MSPWRNVAIEDNFKNRLFRLRLKRMTDDRILPVAWRKFVVYEVVESFHPISLTRKESFYVLDLSSSDISY